MSRQYFYWRVISEGEARANRQLILNPSSHTNVRQAESLCFFCVWASVSLLATRYIYKKHVSRKRRV